MTFFSKPSIQLNLASLTNSGRQCFFVRKGVKLLTIKTWKIKKWLELMEIFRCNGLHSAQIIFFWCRYSDTFYFYLEMFAIQRSLK